MQDPRMMNTTSLAFLGDAVYEVYIRNHVMESGQVNANRLHSMAVKYVRAQSQAFVLKQMLGGFLTEEETALAKRARNHRSSSRPRHADPVDYKLATAFEALIGYLYLKRDEERAREIMAEAVRLTDASEPRGSGDKEKK